jgi:uncharacterized protein (DUF1697 family)
MEVLVALLRGINVGGQSRKAEQLGKLGVPLTLRNWRTTTTLAVLAGARLS